jgi:8-oxo-dGTP diphosphatase
MIVLAIVKKSNNYLLIKKKEDPLVGWIFPGGRKEYFDKSERDTAERETLEETGVYCRAIKRFGERIHPITGIRISYWLCDYVKGKEAVYDENEIARVKWATDKEVLDTIGERIFQPVKDFIGNSS